MYLSMHWLPTNFFCFFIHAKFGSELIKLPLLSIVSSIIGTYIDLDPHVFGAVQ